MDLVLGLSMTSKAVRWVLVEGTTGEGATTNRGASDPGPAVDPDELLDGVLAHAGEDRIHAIGVTWSDAAEDVASEVLKALRARGYADVIAVSGLEAADVLAAGIAEVAEYETVAVCIVEPDAAVVAMADADGVAVDRIGRPLDGADAVELPSSVIATLALNDWRPDAIFVLGSADDLDLIVSTIDGVTGSPVICSADGDLALARGAALAAARAVNVLAPARFRLPTRAGALTAAVVAAAVTFVVSASAAVGLGFTPAAHEELPRGDDAAAAAAPAAPPTSVEAATKARLTVSLQEARPLVAHTMVVPAAPEAAPVAEPVDEPPAAAPPVAPPPPAHVPPAPAYVPPVPKPRLRDRIIERIPLINRFHEPQYQYGP